MTDILPFAVGVRSRLLSLCERLQNCAAPRDARATLPSLAPAFCGKDQSGRPLLNHRHAFFLPVDEDDDGRLDHVAIYAPMGFSTLELQAIDRFRTLRRDESEFHLALVGLGVPDDFARSRLLGPSECWDAVTPFLVTRHLKRRGRKRDPLEWSEDSDGRSAFVLSVLREELARRDALEHQPGRFAGADIELIEDHRIGPRRVRTCEFRLQRKPGDDGARRPRGAFRIRFPRPVQGPISLGHSCHFGLGLFVQSGVLGSFIR